MENYGQHPCQGIKNWSEAPSCDCLEILGYVLSLFNVFLWNVAQLVGGLEHSSFSNIFGIIIPIDFHIFQRGWNHQPDNDTEDG